MYIFCCTYCFCVVHFRLTLDESALQNNTLLHYITCMATVTHTRLLCTVHSHCHPHPSPLHRAWPLSPTPVSSAPCMATVTHTRLLCTVHGHCHPHPSLAASQSQCRSLFWMPCRLLDTVQALARCRTASRYCPLLTHRHVSTR